MKKINNRRFKGIIASMLLLVFMLSSCFAVYASSYSTTVAFKAPYSGATRSFDGQNIQYTASTSSDNPDYIVKVYYVSLYRKKAIGSTLVGTSTELQRDGTANVKWSNVGSGKYYIYFSKATDGIYVRSKNVVIKNY